MRKSTQRNISYYTDSCNKFMYKCQIPFKIMRVLMFVDDQKFSQATLFHYMFYRGFVILRQVCWNINDTTLKNSMVKRAGQIVCII